MHLICRIGPLRGVACLVLALACGLARAAEAPVSAAPVETGSTGGSPHDAAGQEPSSQGRLLRTEIDLLRREFQLQVDRRVGRLESWLTTIGILVAALGVGTLAGMVATKQWAANQVREQIRDAMYRVDPTYLDVKLPRELAEMKPRLEGLGFKKVSVYEVPSAAECLGGCVVVHVAGADDLETFKTFLRDESPDPSKVGYVLYTEKHIPGLSLDFDRLSLSNMPTTIAPQIFATARDLLCSRAAG